MEGGDDDDEDDDDDDDDAAAAAAVAAAAAAAAAVCLWSQKGKRCPFYLSGFLVGFHALLIELSSPLRR